MIDSDTRQFPSSVSILCEGGEGYGIRRCLLDMAHGLKARGIAVHFVMQNGDGVLAELVASQGWSTFTISQISLPAVSGKGLGKAANLVARGMRAVRAGSVLARQVQAADSDAILLCSPLETLTAVIAARRTGRRAFWMIPNAISDYPFDFNRRVYRAMFRHGNLVPLANSHFTDGTLGPGQFVRRVCHLGIDPAEFDPEQAQSISRAQLGIPDDAIVIGLFARMIEAKGQLQLVRAIAALGEEASNVHLLMCGGPQGTPDAARLDGAIRSLGLASRVHNFGEQDDIAGYYRLCDIVANARLDPEPFGLSVIEGMMLGKPVLAHRAGGPAETVVDGETGWLIPSPDLGDFTTSLRRALAERDRWPALGAAARRRALEHFTAGQMVDRVLAAMREL